MSRRREGQDMAMFQQYSAYDSPQYVEESPRTRNRRVSDAEAMYSPRPYDEQQRKMSTESSPRKNSLQRRPSENAFHEQQQQQAANEPFVWQPGPEIGRGAYGVVYQGLNLKTGSFMAVKKLKIDDTQPSSSTEVLHEIKLMSTLDHENIVRYLGADLQEGSLYIFMEFVPGGSIARLLKHFKRLHESVVRLYTKKILTGLHYLHRNNIVHGDIKAANILVSNDGVVKLSDFGHSRVVQQGMSVSENSIRGTPMWMAPEVITESRHGKPSDIWSLGCTIIEMITGELPWPDLVKLEPFAIMYKIAQTKQGPEIPEDLSDLGKDFLRKCFDVNPKTRATVDELLQHPFATENLNCWTDTPGQQQSPQVVPTVQEIQPRRGANIAQDIPLQNSSSKIQLQLQVMTEQIDRILQEQSVQDVSYDQVRARRMVQAPVQRVQSCPSVEYRSPSGGPFNGKRRSQPVENYGHNYQQSYIPPPVVQQRSYRIANPQEYQDGSMNTQHLYSPQQGM